MITKPGSLGWYGALVPKRANESNALARPGPAQRMEGWGVVLGAVASGPLLGEPPAAGPFDQHRHEIPHRAVIEAAVLAVHRPLHLVGGQVWELTGESWGDLADRVLLGRRVPGPMCHPLHPFPRAI